VSEGRSLKRTSSTWGTYSPRSTRQVPRWENSTKRRRNSKWAIFENSQAGGRRKRIPSEERMRKERALVCQLFRCTANPTSYKGVIRVIRVIPDHTYINGLLSSKTGKLIYLDVARLEKFLLFLTVIFSSIDSGTKAP